jgi:hypothetical protein
VKRGHERLPIEFDNLNCFGWFRNSIQIEMCRWRVCAPTVIILRKDKRAAAKTRQRHVSTVWLRRCLIYG